LKKPNPFNPALPADPINFVGRAYELGEFSSRLDSTINCSPLCLAIVGNRGIGKSSFLAKCGEIARRRGCVVIRFSAISGEINNLEDLCNLVLLEIHGELEKRSKLGLLKKDIDEFVRQFSFRIGIGDVGVEIKKGTSAPIYSPALQLAFREKMLSVWGRIKDEFPAVVIMIDEAESLENVPGALMFLREVFSRLGEEKCGYMILLSGKLAFPEKMTEAFSPLTRFFHPECLRNLSEKECGEFLQKSLSKTGIGMDENAIKMIYQLSNGHPYVLVSAARTIYENLEDAGTAITEKHFRAFLSSVLRSLDTEFFGQLFGSASPLGKEVLGAMAELGGSASFSHIVTKLNKPKGSVSPVLAELVESGAVEKKQRGEYSLFHNLFREYLLNRSG
jgi:DNA-binding transcriptional ArsR family regulator